jgi:hypothetical protein
MIDVDDPRCRNRILASGLLMPAASPGGTGVVCGGETARLIPVMACLLLLAGVSPFS